MDSKQDQVWPLVCHTGPNVGSTMFPWIGAMVRYRAKLMKEYRLNTSVRTTTARDEISSFQGCPANGGTA